MPSRTPLTERRLAREHEPPPAKPDPPRGRDIPTPVLAVMGVLIVAALLVIGVGIRMLGESSSRSDGSGSSFTQAQEAVRNYTACPGGMTLGNLVDRAMARTGGPQAPPPRVIASPGAGDTIRVAFTRGTGPGSEPPTVFIYHPRTGRVGAESNDAAAMLRTIETMCTTR